MQLVLQTSALAKCSHATFSSHWYYYVAYISFTVVSVEELIAHIYINSGTLSAVVFLNVCVVRFLTKNTWLFTFSKNSRPVFRKLEKY